MVAICASAREGVGLGSTYVRFGSKADMCAAKSHVRFTPKSGHVQRKQECPLCANSGHGEPILPLSAPCYASKDATFSKAGAEDV